MCHSSCVCNIYAANVNIYILYAISLFSLKMDRENKYMCALRECAKDFVGKGGLCSALRNVHLKLDVH